MTGKKERPVTEPIYSGGNLNDFPISSGYDVINYTEFISSYMFNSERIVTSQSMNNGYFSACFATTILYKPRPSATWWICRDYDSFLTFVKEQWENSIRIYSLACDERFGFGVFLMENFGANQAIITNTSDIQKFWKDGFRISTCTARGSTFYIIMTKGTNPQDDKILFVMTKDGSISEYTYKINDKMKS